MDLIIKQMTMENELLQFSNWQYSAFFFLPQDRIKL